MIQISDIIKGTYGSIYSLSWNAGKAFILLRADGSGYLFFPHDVRTAVPLRAVYLKNPQDVVEGQTGPGYSGTPTDLRHRIVFWVDFKNTPGTGLDDQRFDGYFFTTTKDGMSGLTVQDGLPGGFTAKYEGDVIG